MADVLILGAGVSGHTAAQHARRLLGKDHTITVVTPNSQWNWIPSNIWVGAGVLPKEKVVFPLKPVYDKLGIRYVQALARTIWPEGDDVSSQGMVEVSSTAPGTEGQVHTLRYDYLINATGPKLRFDKTPGLGPDGGHTVSVCTADHAEHAYRDLTTVIDQMKSGKTMTLVVGMGHGTCTCEGAAFEYTFNVDHELRQAGVRDKARLIYLTNEARLGDFGVGGMTFVENGFETTSELWTASLFRERGIEAIMGAHVQRVEPGVVYYEDLAGDERSIEFDFGMLLPPFTGVGLTARNRDGDDITDQLFAPNGFMKVDADYSGPAFADWSAADWPSTYESPDFPNVFAAGIAFAPPHPISEPRSNPAGTSITPAPPRTGMPSGVIGRVVAETIADRIAHGDDTPAHSASMAHMGAACVASAGYSLIKGSAAAMTMMPIVPDYDRYPTGRDTDHTRGEIGLAAHWIKVILHHLFLHKARARPGWFLIPE